MEVVAEDEPPAAGGPSGATPDAGAAPARQGQQHQAAAVAVAHQHYGYGKQHDTNGSGGRLGSRGNGCGYEGGERRMVDITRDKPIKVAVRVQVPVRDHPKFNFVGKLLGPKGNSLKRLQEDTMCKMAVLGRGSMKDRQKEEELRVSGDPKFSHLMEDLHVEISAYATPAEAHARIAYALAEVRRFLVPDYNDDIRQEQMLEMQILNTRGREAGGGGQAQAEAPLSPASSFEAAGSPTAATTASSLDGLQEECAATRPTPSPPHSASLKVQAGTILPSVTSGLGGRKRPLLPGALPAMSPTKRTVMSLLARASAAQNKDSSGLQPPTCPIVAAQPQQPPGQQQHQAQAVAGSPLIQAALQLPGGPASAAVPTVASQQAPTSQQQQQQQQQQHQVTQLHQLAAAAAAAQSLPQRQPLLQSHSQHPVLAPTIHGLLHAQRAAAAAAAAAGPTVLPILREDFMAGVNQHQVQNVHIA